MTYWYVISPDYQYMENVIDGMGPVYDTNDHFEIEAPSRRIAVLEAVRAWSKERDSWVNNQRRDGKSPFTGVKAVTEEEISAEQLLMGPGDARYCDKHGIPCGNPLWYSWNEEGYWNSTCKEKPSKTVMVYNLVFWSYRG